MFVRCVIVFCQLGGGAGSLVLIPAPYLPLNPIYIMPEINKQRILFFRTFCVIYETGVFKFK